MGNSELLSSESVSITADAYLEGLHIKYDFYLNVLGIIFLLGVFFFVLYMFTRDY